MYRIVQQRDSGFFYIQKQTKWFGWLYARPSPPCRTLQEAKKQLCLLAGPPYRVIEQPAIPTTVEEMV